MTVKGSTASLCRKCLIQSLDLNEMIAFAQQVLHGYDLRKRMGISERIPVSNYTAAQRIIEDLDRSGLFIDFVEFLIMVDHKGFMGHTHSMRGLDSVIGALMHEGYNYDKTANQFFENQRERISLNWGRLKDGDERQMSVLRLDIAGNSVLVKNNPQDKIQKAYAALREIVNRAVTNRLGRLWSWEGDGALAVFFPGPKEQAAVFCGMEILHEVFFYNKLENPLSDPIRLRIGAHVGKVHYFNSSIERLKNEAVKETVKLEEAVPNDSMGVSYNLFITMDHSFLKLLGPEKTKGNSKYRLYQVSQERS
jgi:class 3 adenylate cyclase